MNATDIDVKEAIAERLKFFLLPENKTPREISITVSYENSDARITITPDEIGAVSDRKK